MSKARPCPVIGVAGTSPAMTIVEERSAKRKVGDTR